MKPSNLEILAYEDSPLGPLCLRRRELLSAPGTVVTEVTLNHEFLMSSYYTVSETALSRLALDMHQGSELSVLIGGLGLGYTARAALESPRVEEVVVLELLPQVVDWLERDLLPLSGELRADHRFRTETGDFFQRMAAPASDRFDLILLDIDHAPNQFLDRANAPFYTREGLISARAHLTRDGVLAIWSSAPSPDFMEGMEAVFAEVKAEPVTFYNALAQEETTDWIFLGR